MSPRHPETNDLTGGKMEVPQAVIAQAEAAASSNQPEDGQRHSRPASDQTPEALGSNETRPESADNGQKYACSRFLVAKFLILRLQDS